MVIAANADNPFKRLFELMGYPDLANNPKYMTHEGRYEDRELFDDLIGKWAQQHDSAEITEKLEAAGVPSAPIYSAEQIYKDRYFWERGMIIEVPDPEIGNVPMPGVMPKLTGTPGVVNWTGPQLGEHNEEVFKNVVGLSDSEYQDYKSKGII